MARVGNLLEIGVYGSVFKHNGFTTAITDSFFMATWPTQEYGLAWKTTDTIGLIRVSSVAGVERIYIHTGFSATIADSFNSPTGYPHGVEWDGENLLSGSFTSPTKHFKHLGASSTISDSYTCADTYSFGLAWMDKATYNSVGVLSIGATVAYNHLLHYGFSSTIQTSYALESYPAWYDVAWDGGNALLHQRVDGVYSAIRRVRFSATTWQTCTLGTGDYAPRGIAWDSKDVEWGNYPPRAIVSADINAQKHYQHSGFSDTITESYTSPSILPTGIAIAGSNVISADRNTNRHYRHVGFSASISFSYATPSVDPTGIGWDETNVISADVSSGKHYRHVGFTAAIFFSYAAPGYGAHGISWDGSNVISAAQLTAKHYKHSGFTSSVTDSYATPGANAYGITWAVDCVISADYGTDKHYIHAGFSSSIFWSYSSPSTYPTGVDYGSAFSEWLSQEGEITFGGELIASKNGATLKVVTSTFTPTGIVQPRAEKVLSGGFISSGDLTTREAIKYTKTLEGGLSFVVEAESTSIIGTRGPIPPDPPPPEPPPPPPPRIWHRTLRGRLRFWGVIGTKNTSDPPPEPPPTGITFHLRLSGSFTPEGDLAGAEYIWPTGTFDKGAIFDSMTMDEEVVSGGPDGRIAASRNHPHRGKYYLAVHKPEQIFDAAVDTVTPSVGGTQVTYTGATGTYTDCLAGMTVKVYDSTGEYKGKVRLRSITSDTLNVAEQDDLDWTIGDLFEVYDVMELWAKFPRVIEDPGNPGTLIFYRDWDVTPASEAYPMKYSAARCVPVIGPPTCAFLDDATAEIYFTAKHSYNVNSGLPPAWWSWTFQSGTPATSSVETPGNVAWSAAGTYRVKCAVEAAAPGHTPVATYRYIHIFERTGAFAPYTNFRVTNLSGSVSEGGWNAEFEVYDDVDVADFPDGAQIILFAEELLGEYDFGSEFAQEERQNVKYVGYIVGGSVIKDPDTHIVRFRTTGIHVMMQNRDNFSVALDYSSDGDATVWEKQSGLSANYAFLNLLMWNSTLMNITDVFLPAYYYETWPSITHKASEYLTEYQDFSRDTLWSQLSTLAADVFARVLVSKFGEVSIVNDPQYTAEVDLWADLPVPYTFEPQDWIAPITIEFVDEPVVSVVCVEGIAFDGTTSSAVIGYHPGELPTYRGKMETKSRCILTSVDEADMLAEHLYSIRNNTYPVVLMNCMGNYSFLDITNLGGIQMSLAAADTRYGLAWSKRRLFIESVAHTIDFTTGILSTQIQLTAFAYLRRPYAGA